MSRIAAEFHMPGVTKEMYEKLIEEYRALEAADPSLGAGRIIHVAMPEDGGWYAFDVWESAEAFERLGRVLGPLFEKHGIAAVQPVVYPVHSTMS